jgi:rubredoxin
MSDPDRKWQCEACGYLYDPAKGAPSDGIAPGTPWPDLPKDWICPDCGATRAEFCERDDL